MILQKFLYPNKSTQSFVYPACSILLFATYAVLGKTLVSQVPALLIPLYVQGVSILLFGFWMGIFPELKKTFRETRKCKKAFLLFSFFSGALGPIFYFLGLSYTSAINAILLANVYPVFLLSISYFVFKKRLTKFEVWSVVIILIGVGIIIFNGNMNVFDLQLNVGDFYIVLAELLYCIGDVIYKSKLTRLHTDVAMLGRNFCGFLFLTLVGVMFLPSLQFEINNDIFTVFMMLAIFPMLLGQFFWYKSVKVCSSFVLSKTKLLLPVVATVYAVILLDESLTMYHLLGAVFVLGGLLIQEIYQKYSAFARVFHFRNLQHPKGDGHEMHYTLFDKIRILSNSIIKKTKLF